MKLKEGFVTYETGNVQFLTSTDKTIFSGLIKNNATAAFIVSSLKEEISFEDLCRRITEKYEVSDQEAEADLKEFLEGLRKVGALDE